MLWDRKKILNINLWKIIRLSMRPATGLCPHISLERVYYIFVYISLVSCWLWRWALWLGQHGLEIWLVLDLKKMWKSTSLLLHKSLLLSSYVRPLLAHDHDCPNFCSFLLSNLAKLSYRWSPLQLHHTIGKKKTLFLMKSCTEHYIVTDVVPSDEGCAAKLM
jgi:hypothetical protein